MIFFPLAKGRETDGWEELELLVLILKMFESHDLQTGTAPSPRHA